MAEVLEAVAAEVLGTAVAVTVEVLEAHGIEFQRNDRKQRIYYEKDIRALTNMKELLDLQQPLDDAARIIAEKIEKGAFDAPEPVNNAEITPSVIGNTNAQITLEEMKQMMMQVAAAAAEEKIKAYKLEEQQKLLESVEERKQRTFNEMVLHKRLDARLQERAREAWDKLPEEERITKSLFGLIRSENTNKKDRFISKYVNERYEQELRKELDITDDAG